MMLAVLLVAAACVAVPAAGLVSLSPPAYGWFKRRGLAPTLLAANEAAMRVWLALFGALCVLCLAAVA